MSAYGYLDKDQDEGKGRHSYQDMHMVRIVSVLKEREVRNAIGNKVERYKVELR